MIEEKVRKIISSAVLRAHPVSDIEVELSSPSDPRFGDFTTNVAMVLASRLGGKPRLIAEKIMESVSDPEGFIESLSVAGPGFLNLTVKPGQWIRALSEIAILGENFGSNNDGSGKKAVVEFVSANPTGPLHIGNARGGPLGDAIAGLLGTAGFNVTREYYVNDIGVQIDELGKTIHHLVINDKEKAVPDFGEGRGYKGGYVADLAGEIKRRFPESLPDISTLGKLGIEIMMEEIRNDCSAMGIVFDEWVCEKDLLESGETGKILGQLKKTGVVVERDGASWFAPKDDLIEDRECVLERSDGRRPTYFANDIAYHAGKYRRSFDLIVNVWGSNHHGHVSRIKAAVKSLGFDPERIRTVLYQYVRVKRGKEVVKMSKRGGNFVTAREVLDEVGCDAFRFFLLMRSPEAHLDFDLELAKKQSHENPVYYVQYAHARISSIFAKGAEAGLKPPDSFDPDFEKCLCLPEEIALAKFLLGYKSVIRQAVKDLTPHRVAFYILELARMFQSYYDKARTDDRYRVLGDDKKSSMAKLFLLFCLRQVIRNALCVLGISAPEKM